MDWMDDFSSIKQELEKHADEINAMEPVAVVEYSPMTKKQVKDLTVEQLGKVGGGRMIRNGISFDFEAGIGTVLAHASEHREYAAILASPYVAKYGKRIAGHRNHKKKGNPTLTYAAPVVINGETVNVGAAILFTADGRSHAVNVGLQSGGAFRIKMTKAPQGFRSRVYQYGKGTALPTTGAFDSKVPHTAAESQEENSATPIEQEITSEDTSLNQIPALFKHDDVQFGKTNVDIGGGK
ncbi:MAG: hypothetical protein IKD96_05055 [Oscillospiraceae bacterium]|nr:hypothetical protein [Oscillospiraceae bacterium]